MSSPRAVTIEGVEWTQDELMDLIALVSSMSPAKFPDFPTAARVIVKAKAQALLWKSIAVEGAL